MLQKEDSRFGTCKKNAAEQSGGIFLREFNIFIRSFQKVQAFVSLAMVQPFEVLVGNEQKRINGKSFMGMFSLDYKDAVRVSVKCSEEEFLRFRQDAARFLA